MTKKLFVVFDDGPGATSGRFVDVETEDGESVRTRLRWTQRGDGYWTLGPFVEAPSVNAQTKPGPTVTISFTEARALADWAAARSRNVTLDGPEFDAAMRVARTLRDLLG